MSVRVMAMVFDLQDVRPSEKLVLLALADYAADDGSQIYPSIATIERKTCLGERTIQDCCQCLARRGILIADPRPGRTTLWQINVQALTETPPQIPHPRKSRTPAQDAPHPRKSRTPTPANPAPYPSLEPSSNHKPPLSPFGLPPALEELRGGIPISVPWSTKLDCPEFRSIWHEWQQWQKAQGLPGNVVADQLLLSELERQADPVGLVKHSLARKFKGVVIPEAKQAKPDPKKEIPDHIRFRKRPLENTDMWNAGSTQDPVTGVIELHYCWIRDGERTDEPFNVTEWARGRVEAGFAVALK